MNVYIHTSSEAKAASAGKADFWGADVRSANLVSADLTVMGPGKGRSKFRGFAAGKVSVNFVSKLSPANKNHNCIRMHIALVFENCNR